MRRESRKEARRLVGTETHLVVRCLLRPEVDEIEHSLKLSRRLDVVDVVSILVLVLLGSLASNGSSLALEVHLRKGRRSRLGQFRLLSSLLGGFGETHLLRLDFLIVAVDNRHLQEEKVKRVGGQERDGKRTRRERSELTLFLLP